MDELECVKRPIRGQKPCPKCKKLYNNRALPQYCTEENCDGYLGGKAPVKMKEPAAQLITPTIASVRKNPCGVAVRVFVDVRSNQDPV